MGLKVWLPLDGNLENKGASAVLATAIETPTYVAGKIGQCYQRTNSSSLLTNGLNLNSNLLDILKTQASIAVWVKPLGTHTHYNGTIASSGNWNAKKWAFGVSQDNSKVDVLCGGYNNYITCSVPVNQWTHLASTFDNGTCKLYKNGIYVGQLTGQAAFVSDATNTCIARETYASGYFGFNGCINDVRIYNHCLSAAEIHEISLGLVLHYQLDSFWGGFGNPNLGNTSATYSNQLNGVEINTSGWGGDAGKVTYYHSGGYAGLPYKVYHKTATGSGGIYYKTANDIVLEANTTYTMSIWIKASREFSDSAYNFCINRGSDNRYINYGSSFAIKTEWTYYTKTFTTPSDGVGSYGEMSIIYNDAVTDYYIYFSGFKIEKGSVATAWCPPGASLTQILDSSGYGHNGTITGNFNLISDTPRYLTALNYSNSYIDTNIEINTTDSTICMWLNIPSLSTSYHILDARNGSGTGKLPIYTYSNGSILTGGSSAYVNSNTGFLETNKWIFIALVLNGNNLLLYKNGNLFLTISCTNTPIIKPTIGARYSHSNIYTGKMSDFRIYATALSAADVKQLYEMGAKVDNKGSLHTYEFNEFGSNKLKKTGVFYNYATEPYMLLADGSCWKLMLFHYVDGGNNLFASSNATYNDGFGLYSRLRDIDNFKYNNKYEFYVILDDVEYRWTQTNAPMTSTAVTGYTAITGTPGGICKCSGNTVLAASNTTSNWWRACGCWTVYNGGIPGFGSSVICKRYLALYARIDKITYRNASNAHYANNLIEI